MRRAARPREVAGDREALPHARVRPDVVHLRRRRRRRTPDIIIYQQDQAVGCGAGTAAASFACILAVSAHPPRLDLEGAGDEAAAAALDAEAPPRGLEEAHDVLDGRVGLRWHNRARSEWNRRRLKEVRRKATLKHW